MANIQLTELSCLSSENIGSRSTEATVAVAQALTCGDLGMQVT